MAKAKAKKRVEKVAENMVSNGGQLRKAVRDAGYSDAYAVSGKIKKTKSLKELLEKEFPPEKQHELHKELLAKKESTSSFGKITLGTQPHSDVNRTLDMINKIKGVYAPEKHQIVDKYDSMSDEELEQRKVELEEQLFLVKNKPNKKPTFTQKKPKK